MPKTYLRSLALECSSSSQSARTRSPSSRTVRRRWVHTTSAVRQDEATIPSSSTSYSDSTIENETDLASLTHRARKGNKKPLPLPPLLNPEIQASRKRWTKRKPVFTPEHITAFRKRVNENPYVHALASPVRTCAYTESALPVFFLRSLYAKRDPTTSKLWLLPLTDMSVSSPSSQIIRTGLPARYINSHALSLKIVGRPINGTSGAFGPAHDLRTAQRHQKDTFVQDVRSEWTGMLYKKTLVWRADMPELMLSLSRTGAIRALRLLLRRKKRVSEWVEAVESLDDVKHMENVSSVLYLGELPEEYEEEVRRLNRIIERVESKLDKLRAYMNIKLRAEAGIEMHAHIHFGVERWGLARLQPRARWPVARYPVVEVKVRPEKEVDRPGEFAAAGTSTEPLEFTESTSSASSPNPHTKKVPCFQLKKLLGEDGLKEVLEGTRFEGRKWIVVKEGAWTRAAQMRLLRLEGYLCKGV